MKYLATLLLALAALHLSAQEKFNTIEGPVELFPVQHATMVLKWQNKTIYVDPNGGKEAFANFSSPDLILITDIHGDHLNIKTLLALDTKNSIFIVPSAVAEKLSEIPTKEIMILSNGDSLDLPLINLKIRALPMYNLPVSEDARHTKGRGNGYLLTMGGKQLYISGDTEAIPEMRSLKGIDIALICMNLPYTMDVQQAADGVLDFKPAMAIPYHYRGQGGLSDINLFKELVQQKNKDIEVRLLDWYPNK